MLCRIAELLIEVPEAGGLSARCQDYLWDGKEGADMIIRTDLYNPAKYLRALSENDLAYMESARQFCAGLLDFGGFYLHASAVEMDGKAYLFSAKSGVGKSTHTRLWQQLFEGKAQVFNDDKPALRYLDGVWYAYGTPWCGKDGINQNKKVPLAGVCFLRQAGENKIRQLTKQEALGMLFSQTIRRFSSARKLDLLLGHLENLVDKIPVFELENRPEPEAARLSYETMSRKAEEMGL